jgi:hypothetical protein
VIFESSSPLIGNLTVNGWFPRLNAKGQIVSGAGTIVLTDIFASRIETLEPQGHAPVWHEASAFVFQGPNDLLWRRDITQAKATVASPLPTYYYSAGAGTIALFSAPDIGGTVDTVTGDIISVVEHNGSNTDRSILREGQALTSHRFVNDPRAAGDIVAWKDYGATKIEYFDGSVKTLNTTGWVGNPVPIYGISNTPWILYQTMTELRLQPLNGTSGHRILTGEDMNFHPDGVYLPASDHFFVVWNDKSGVLHTLLIPAKAELSPLVATPVPVNVTVQPFLRKTWVAPFFSYSERYGDTWQETYRTYANAIMVVPDERDPEPSLKRELDRLRPLNMPLIVEGTTRVEDINVNQTIAWWVAGGDMFQLGAHTIIASLKPEKPIMAYLDGRGWSPAKPSWITDRVWPSIQCYRLPGEPLEAFKRQMTAVLDTVAAYGQPMVLTPRFDDFNGSGTVEQTMECMAFYNWAMQTYRIVGFMPFADRRGNGIAKQPQLVAAAKAFLAANPDRPNRFDYWVSSGSMAVSLRNKLGQKTENIILLPAEKAYLLNLLRDK